MKAVHLEYGLHVESRVETPASKTRAKSRLAACEQRADVRTAFENLEKNESFTLEAARAAFSGVRTRKI